VNSPRCSVPPKVSSTTRHSSKRNEGPTNQGHVQLFSFCFARQSYVTIILVVLLGFLGPDSSATVAADQAICILFRNITVIRSLCLLAEHAPPPHDPSPTTVCNQTIRHSNTVSNTVLDDYIIIMSRTAGQASKVLAPRGPAN
jgi:hypothetical protein